MLDDYITTVTRSPEWTIDVSAVHCSGRDLAELTVPDCACRSSGPTSKISLTRTPRENYIQLQHNIMQAQIPGEPAGQRSSSWATAHRLSVCLLSRAGFNIGLAHCVRASELNFVVALR